MPVRTEGGAVRFQLPGGRGEYRGHGLHGHFVQAPTVAGGTRYATPVDLERMPDRTLRGEVAPLEDRFDLYLLVSEGAEGRLTALVRNPDFNFGRGRPLAVEEAGAALRFVDASGRELLRGRFDQKQDRLLLDDPLGAGEIALTRRGRAISPSWGRRSSTGGSGTAAAW